MTAGVWKATKNHWLKYYKPVHDPMPSWLAKMNPKFAKAQEKEREEIISRVKSAKQLESTTIRGGDL
jgi:uncharacterized Zn finger protein